MIYFVRAYFFGIARIMLACQGMWPAAMMSPFFFQATHPKKNDDDLYPDLEDSL